jgi:hypothetical protein
VVVEMADSYCSGVSLDDPDDDYIERKTSILFDEKRGPIAGEEALWATRRNV